MKIYNDLLLKFESPDWTLNPAFCVFDTIIEKNPSIIEMMKDDIMGSEPFSEFGRQDTPSVEQIVRAAIFKEMRGYDYRELEYAQSDSRICEQFIKLDGRKPFSFQMFQKYISRIKSETIELAIIEINKIALSEGLEDVQSITQDTTVVKSNIHYPTNSALVWDCIRTCTRLLEDLKKEITDLNFTDYTRAAKKTHFKINVTHKKELRDELFCNQLILFTKVINETSNAVKKKSGNLIANAIQSKLSQLLPLMIQVYNMTFFKEYEGKKVPNGQKIFSIFEPHTDIIVKGQREVQFGHKINIASGKSNLILDIQVLTGNPSDKSLYQPTMDNIIKNYGIVPRDSTADGGFASMANREYAQTNGIVNIVFNKVVGKMQNIASSLNMETRLKKWRSASEAVISNLKRGFNIRTCNWKGWLHFKAKVMWSVMAYNLRVITALMAEKITAKMQEC